MLLLDQVNVEQGPEALSAAKCGSTLTKMPPKTRA
jgi:hypothetical protein